jgi:hypothetical protein
VGTVIESILDTYLSAYRGLLMAEPVDGNSVTISFPLHLAAHHRIEITVTDLGVDKCIISDGARTLGEVQDAGYSLTTPMKERLEGIANLSGVRIVKDHLVLESSYRDVGTSIQKFLEMSKMIGDVYLVHRQRANVGDELVAQVRKVLNSKKILYRVRSKLQGKYEAHQFDIVAPPNGHKGLAVSILPGQNTHNTAQVWYCKCDDIKRLRDNRSIRLGLIYDVRFDTWSETSKALLRAKADIAIPSDSLGELPEQLAVQGVIEQRSKPHPIKARTPSRAVKSPRA